MEATKETKIVGSQKGNGFLSMFADGIKGGHQDVSTSCECDHGCWGSGGCDRK